MELVAQCPSPNTELTDFDFMVFLSKSNQHQMMNHLPEFENLLLLFSLFVNDSCSVSNDSPTQNG